MRRWDGLVDRYLDEYEVRGRAAGTIDGLRRELDRCGTWFKNRRPRLDEVDSDLLIGYLQSRTAFRAKTTLSGVMSKLRGLGEFLTREGIWSSNPLRWMRGPRRDLRSRLPRRISRPAMTQLWEAAARAVRLFTLLAATAGGVLRHRCPAASRGGSSGPQANLLQFDGHKTSWERRAGGTAGAMSGSVSPKRRTIWAQGGVTEPALFVAQARRLSGSTISQG
jgi:hypothetical protein